MNIGAVCQGTGMFLQAMQRICEPVKAETSPSVAPKITVQGSK